MLELRVHLARVHHAAFAHEVQYGRGLGVAVGRPHGAGGARVHQRLHLPRQEAVVDEEVFLDPEPRIAGFQVTSAVALHPVAQRQVLRPRRRADRVSLHEAQPGDGLGQGGGREQGARHGMVAQVVQGDGGHAGSLAAAVTILACRNPQPAPLRALP